MAEFEENDSVVIPIQCDVNKHPIENDLCLLYVKILDGDDYLLPFRHSESMNLDVTNLDKLNSDQKKYVYNRK